MQTHTSSIISPRANRSVTPNELVALAGFHDRGAKGVSFYFSLSSTPDNSHRAEVLMIKELVKKNAGPQLKESGITSDLDEMVEVAEEVRRTPSRLRAIFTCHDQHVWHAFDLPANGSISRLDIGRHFHLRPLLQAAEASAPYCVVMVEHGKARGFVAQGSDIQEIHGKFMREDLALHAEDSRVGWSHHIEDNIEEHKKRYVKEVSGEIAQFAEEHGRPGLIVGCREDLWSELEPHLSPAGILVIGRFLPPNFEVSPAEVLEFTKPIFEKSLAVRYNEMLRRIKESVSHGVIGLDQVLENLEEGRVQKLLLGNSSGTTISECSGCGRLYPALGIPCVFCRSGNTHEVLAEEALIRKALLTGAEIFLPITGASDGFEGAAAWLRY